MQRESFTRVLIIRHIHLCFFLLFYENWPNYFLLKSFVIGQHFFQLLISNKKNYFYFKIINIYLRVTFSYLDNHYLWSIRIMNVLWKGNVIALHFSRTSMKLWENCCLKHTQDYKKKYYDNIQQTLNKQI